MNILCSRYVLYVQPIGHQLLIGEGPTYGYRLITALANSELGRRGGGVINHKRTFRIMRQNAGLLARRTGRRNGRLHDGKVISLIWAPTCAGVQTGLRLPAGTGTS